MDAFFGVVEHFAELLAAVGVLLGCGLGFDEAAVGEHDDVHVDGGAGVFFVAEVEEDVAVRRCRRRWRRSFALAGRFSGFRLRLVFRGRGRGRRRLR